MFTIALLLLFRVFGLVTCLDSTGSYKEDLTLQPLPRDALLAAFSFRSNSSYAEYEQQNFNLFPRSLGQILLHTHTEELHLRFALGRWDAENWGARPRGGRREGGTGVELWAWVRADSEEEYGHVLVVYPDAKLNRANSRWFTLTNALSGLFCASLNFVDQTKTIRPQAAFSREGTRPAGSLYHLHGALPNEVVCTENLTPFLKLLPCKGKAGIASLLDGHKLFDASWQTMGIDVRSSCSAADDQDCQIEIEQTVDMVLDIDRSMRPSKDPIPRPPPIESIQCNITKSYNGHDTCFPEVSDSERAWNIKDVFGREIQGSCPLGSSSSTAPNEGEIELIVPTTRDISATVSNQPIDPLSTTPEHRTYRLPTTGTFNIHASSHPLSLLPALQPPLLLADRTITGHGQERGGVHTVLTNTSPSELHIIYLESLPWFMKPYLHTLTLTTGPAPAPIRNILYRPALDRRRGTLLELTIAVPPHAALELRYAFDKAILRYTEYPPDANRGFDVAAAVVRVLGGRGGEDAYVRTTSLLLPLPTPDFSMPYNVIILTSTVIAMGFGGMFNILTRRFGAADEADGVGVGGLKGRVREVVLGKVARVRDRWRGLKGGEAKGGGGAVK